MDLLKILFFVGDTHYLEQHLSSLGTKTPKHYRDLIAKEDPRDTICNEGLKDMAQFL